MALSVSSKKTATPTFDLTKRLLNPFRRPYEVVDPAWEAPAGFNPERDAASVPRLELTYALAISQVLSANSAEDYKTGDTLLKCFQLLDRLGDAQDDESMEALKNFPMTATEVVFVVKRARLKYDNPWVIGSIAKFLGDLDSLGGGSAAP